MCVHWRLRIVLCKMHARARSRRQVQVCEHLLGGLTIELISVQLFWLLPCLWANAFSFALLCFALSHTHTDTLNFQLVNRFIFCCCCLPACHTSVNIVILLCAPHCLFSLHMATCGRRHYWHSTNYIIIFFEDFFQAIKIILLIRRVVELRADYPLYNISNNLFIWHYNLLNFMLIVCVCVLLAVCCVSFSFHFGAFAEFGTNMNVFVRLLIDRHLICVARRMRP